MKYSIGIDIGGTKVEAVLINEKGKVLQKKRIKTVKNKSKFLTNLIELINDVNTQHIEGIGVGVPGLVSHTGKLLWLPNLKTLEGINLKEDLEKKYNVRVYVQNDANCFALAEFRLGAGKGTRTMVGLIIGTGIGAGLVINKQLLWGGAGEVGHIPIFHNNNITSFERLGSGKNLINNYKKLGGKIKNPYLHDIIHSPEKIAKHITNDFFTYTGILLATLVNTLNPDKIVIGGGVSNGPIYKQLQKEMKKRAVPLLVKDCQVVKNKLGDSAGVIGAGLLLFEDKHNS